MDFRKENPNAYMYAKKHGFIEKIIEEADLCPLRVNLSRETVMTIVDSALKGISIRELSKKYVVSPETIEHVLIWKNILDKPLPWYRERKKHGKTYTDEYIINECKKYKSQKEIRLHARGLLSALERNPHLKEVALAHMEKPGKKYWTYERIKEKAVLCSNQEDMARRFNGAYQAMRRMKLQYEFFPNTKHLSQYTKEDCLLASSKCNSIDEFKCIYPYIFEKVIKTGWYDEVISVIPIETRNDHYSGCRWTEETAAAEAAKYRTRTEFRRACQGAALYADSNPGMMDRICKHMKKQANLMKRCIYSAEFSDNHVYVGLTWNVKRRWKDHVNESNSAIYNYIMETGLDPVFKIIHDFVEEAKAAELESFYEEDYRSKGWILLNRAKAGSLGSGQRIYSHKTVLRIAQGCIDYTDFRNNHRNAYKAAGQYGWVDEIKNFLDVNYKHWTVEELRSLAGSCKTHREFYKHQAAAFAAKRFGIYDEITSHMPPLRNKWTEERIKDVASQFEYYRDFHKQYPSAVNAAVRLGIFDEVTCNMKRMMVEYTDDFVESEVKKYESLKVLRESDPNLYKHLQTLRILDKYFPDEAYKRVPKKKTPYVKKKK